MATVTKTKHTPIPWRVAYGIVDGQYCVTGILAGSRWVVGNVERPFENKEDAEFLCRAANSFDALVQACEDAKRVIRECIPNEMRVPVPGIARQLDAVLKAAKASP